MKPLLKGARSLGRCSFTAFRGTSVCAPAVVRALPAGAPDLAFRSAASTFYRSLATAPSAPASKSLVPTAAGRPDAAALAASDRVLSRVRAVLADAEKVYTDTTNPEMKMRLFVARNMVFALEGGETHTAIKHFDQMTQEHLLAPDQISASLVLAAYALEGRMRPIAELLYKLHTLGIQLRVDDYLTLMESSSRHRLYSNVIRYFEDMRRQFGTALDPAAYALVIAAHRKLGDLASVKAVFEEASARGVLTPYMYEQYLKSCADRQRLDLIEDCERRIEQLASTSSVPVLEHFDALINTYGRLNKLDRALRAFENIELLYPRYTPDARTWMSLLKLFEDRNILVERIAQNKVFLEMRANAGKPIAFGERRQLRETFDRVKSFLKQSDQAMRFILDKRPAPKAVPAPAAAARSDEPPNFSEEKWTHS